jgi:hypothetical protein
VDAVFHLTVNEYRGVRTPQMKLLDLRFTDEGGRDRGTEGR